MRKSEDKRADVAVVGGGVAGLAAARELGRGGLSVVVFDAPHDGGPASNAAAGMLAPQSEADRADELFELLCASRDMYVDFAASLREESGVCIELDRTGTLYLAFTEEDEREASKRFEWQTRAGLEVERLTAEEARALEPQVSTRVRAALRFPRDWQVENRLLVRALRASAERYGVRFVEGVEAYGVYVSRDGRARGVETVEGTFDADAVVFAAGAWNSRLEKLFNRACRMESAALEDAPRVEPVRGQMLSFRQPGGPEPFARHVVYSPRGYVVPRRDGRLLAGSTTEHAGFDASVTDEGVETIKRNAVEIAPAVASLALEESWAGLRPKASDGLPVIGESEDVKGLFYATGYYRNGILLAPASGRIVADLVTRGTTNLAPRALTAFSPARAARTAAGSR
ncbi:MAG TPA: glycine oxidase ThiO [Pyrinomonadaceae bacterium]|jgi:glycine oxidase|nr:glycine oxidase ThiO [Pyrinomonadaceae bacterium]